MPLRRPEKWTRITEGLIASSEDDGPNGAFAAIYQGVVLRVIASNGWGWKESGLDGEPWEHVSLTIGRRDGTCIGRTPHWSEMDFVKRQFWEPGDTVIQLHVPESRHVSFHDYCLHLWRPPYALPLPPTGTIAP